MIRGRDECLVEGRSLLEDEDPKECCGWRVNDVDASEGQAQMVYLFVVKPTLAKIGGRTRFRRFEARGQIDVAVQPLTADFRNGAPATDSLVCAPFFSLRSLQAEQVAPPTASSVRLVSTLPLQNLALHPPIQPQHQHDNGVG